LRIEALRRDEVSAAAVAVSVRGRRAFDATERDRAAG
jgi:hypothetical protein